MFGLFKKKPIPVKTLVGKIHAFYKFTSTPPVRGEFVYNLFENSEGKRSYEVEVLANHQMLYKQYTMDRHAQGGTYHEMLATQHKFWPLIVKPWLQGEELHPKYHISACQCPRYISKALKIELNELLNDMSLEGSNYMDIIDRMRSKLSAAQDA